MESLLNFLPINYTIKYYTFILSTLHCIYTVNNTSLALHDIVFCYSQC